MQKQANYKWKKVNTKKSANNLPMSRWGHTCCVIEDQIIFFGGYADSNYMNDIWTFNSTTMEWNQIRTTGDIPENRSNCTMNYDSQNNRIIIFGGGGPNKKRFNSLSILDWNTKQWLQIKPRQDEPAPWQRTYHSAEFRFPYLAVFGGEGIADLDDLWIFNFLTLSWKQIAIPKNKLKPCGRRFHSSALIKNEMFIIGGCHSKYRSLNDIFSIDLTPLLQKQDYSSLQWKERKLQGSTFLTRWGHTSTVLGDKIYVFGGRFSNDLNDLLVIDFQNNTIRTVKGIQDPPVARRRHCAAFIGSSLLIFGGFNGQYFNDLHYITLFESKNWIIKPQILQKINQLINNPLYSDFQIIDKNKKKTFINLYLMLSRFDGVEKNLKEFIQYLCALPSETIISMLKFLYTGVGEFDKELFSKYNMKGEPNQKYQFKTYYNLIRDTLKSQSRWVESNRLLIQNESSGVIRLKENEWKLLFKENSYTNCTFKLGDQVIKMNNTLLRINNPYFFNLLSGQFQETGEIQITDVSEPVFKCILKFLEYDILLCPQNFHDSQWNELLLNAKYYGIDRLVSICQSQISSTLKNDEIKNLQIFQFAVQNKFQNLRNFCAENDVKRIQKLNRNFNYHQFDRIELKNKIKDEMLKARNKYFKLLYFQLQQNKLENPKLIHPKILNKQNLHHQESEKENSQINS